MGLVSLLLLTAYTLQTKLECEDCPVVRVQQGLLRGTVFTSIRNNENFLGFLGIPYAKPPIGQLRFKEPLPPESWTGIRDATAEGSQCPQKEGFIRILFGTELNVTLGAEDCLFLNVYISKLPTEGEQLKATMVFIHGGGFTFGSGSRLSYNPDFFMDQDVVIVTFNYRLGALGFLSTGDEVIPGNAGLKDQVMALQWIQKNIAQFGGDPNKVTLFGFSAGATSVQYHMLSPMSKGLFHSGIAQSGSVFNRWAFSASPRTFAFRLGALLGLQSNNSEELSTFLNNANYEDIVLATENLLTREEKPAGYGYPFYPCVDNQSRGAVFLPTNPEQLIDSGAFYHLPYLTGVNSQEGIFFILVLREFALSLTNGLELINREFERALPEDFPIPRNTSASQEFASEVKSFYFGDRNVSRETLSQFADLVTDVWFLKDVMSSARKIALTSSPVYFYHFAFDGAWRELKLLLGADSIPGVAHSDEMPYIMPSAVTLILMNPYEEPASTTSKRIVKMWTNFAKTGNPTPDEDPLLMNVNWTPFTNENLAYLNVDKQLEMRNKLHSERLDFWESLYKKSRNFQINT